MWFLAACSRFLPHEVPAGRADPACGAMAVDRERLLADVERLAAHPRASAFRKAAVRDGLRAELADAGFPVEDQRFSISGVEGVNLVARGRAPARVLVGAHYDTVEGSPGADDDASGVAVVLACARALGPSAAVDYALFDDEEPHAEPVGTEGRNYAYGSQAFVDAGARYDAVLVVESVGYRCSTPGCQGVPAGFTGDVRADGTALYWVANQAARWPDLAATFDAAAGATRSVLVAVPGRGTSVLQTRFSDHAPFWDAGMDAVMLTDTALLRNASYHRPSDDHVNPPFLAEVAAGITAAVGSAAGACR